MASWGVTSKNMSTAGTTKVSVILCSSMSARAVATWSPTTKAR